MLLAELVAGLDEALQRGEGLVNGAVLLCLLGVWLSGSRAAFAVVVLLGLQYFLSTSRYGRLIRAVADDHEAALSIGIPLNTIWIVVWSAAGLVALAQSGAMPYRGRYRGTIFNRPAIAEAPANQ